MIRVCPPYAEFDEISSLPDEFYLQDHCGGFDEHGNNHLLDKLHHHALAQGKQFTITLGQIPSPALRERYKNLNLKARFFHQYNAIWKPFEAYNVHPEINYKNFVCSFNGSPHVGRKLLVAALKRKNWFDPAYSSKNMIFTGNQLLGHISDYVRIDGHLPYLIHSENDEEFYNTVYSFGHVQYDHGANIYNLEQKITESFIHIVSECLPTSYYPFVSEKFLYSVVTRGLFLCNAPLEWHSHVQEYYGFKKYTKLFDYRFDSIQNPVERMLALINEVSKFSTLSSDDWRDLYLLEQDTIEFNYDHYFSRSYIKTLANYVEDSVQ